MAHVGIHSFVWSASSDQDSLDRTLEKTKAAGFDMIEFTYFDPAKVDIDRLAKRIAAQGLAVAVSIGMPNDADISSPDKGVAANGAAFLDRLVAMTRDLGGHTLAGILQCAHGLQTQMPSRDNFNRSAHTLAKIAEKAKASDVSINVEIVNRFETNLLNTAAQGIAYIETSGSDNIFLHLDTFHMNIEEADAALAMRHAAGKIGYFHIGESHRGFLGTGSIDWPAIFDVLVAIGYDRDVSFESFSSEIIDQNLSLKTAIWRNLWRDNMELAQHARRFIDLGIETAHRKAALVREEQRP